MSPIFLLTVATGLIAILICNLTVTPRDVLQGNPFQGISVPSLVFLFLFWTGQTAIWLRGLAQRERRRGSLEKSDAWEAMGGLTLLALAAAWSLPILSIDPLYYIGYGRQMTAHHLSPYTVNLWASASDPIVASIPKMWFDNIAFYGPVALALYALANLLTPEPELFRLVFVLKLLWIPFYGLLGWTVWKINEGRRYQATTTLAVLFNPFVVWFCLLDGHVDLLVMTFLLMAAWTASRFRPVWAALALAISASIKIVGVVCTPILFFYFLRRSVRDAGRFAAAFATVYGTEYALVRGGEYLGVIGFTKLWNNLQAGSLLPRLLDLFGVADLDTIRTLSNGGFYAAIAILCLLTWRSRLGDSPYFAMGLAMAALFLTRTYFQPWYTLWFWPLLWFSCGDSRRTYTSLGLWTACMIVIWVVGWDLKIWLISALALTSIVDLAAGLRHEGSVAQR